MFSSYMTLNCVSLNNAQLYIIVIYSHTPYEECKLVKFFWGDLQNGNNHIHIDPAVLLPLALIKAAIMPCPNYSSDLLTEPPTSTLAPLQPILFAAARALILKHTSDCPATLLKIPQWLFILLGRKAKFLPQLTKC